MPRDYAAIHFHEDVLYDCGWETDFVFDIPAGMASGVYGIRLRCDDVEDIVPIYVLPKAGTATAAIAFLASTFTYQIYGNHQRDNVDDAFRARQAEWRAYPWNAAQHPECGASTYNKQRHMLFEPAPAAPDDAAGVHYLFRCPWIGGAAFSSR